jgi:TolB-like protein/tetratricopeptide (TPR) repeat protein
MASHDQLERRLREALADRYRIEKEIGSGGMATVYLARDLKHERDIAIKVLDPDLSETLGAERFLREIKTAANLTHPHILPLHDSGEADGLLFFVMPYVRGESLRTRLDREKQLPVEDAVQIAREISDALAYAHREGVIHRDVKPENILVEAGHAVLSDFGVAHAVAEAKEERLTRTGMSLGTPTYTSPEQASGDRDLDGRSDQYALGCVLYEMLTGQPPFTGTQVESVVRQHLTVDPAPVTQVRTTVPTEVAGALTRALAKSPADRYRTADEFGDALLAGTSSTRTSGGGRRWAPRLSSAAAWLVTVVAVVGAFLIWTGTRAGPSTPVSESSQRVIVLPFDNQTGDPDLDPIGRMVADWITEGLSRTAEVQVVPSLMVLEAISRVQSEAERDAGVVPVTRTAEASGAGIAVTGAIYLLGEELEIRSEVVDLASGASLGAIEGIRGPIADPGQAMEPIRDRIMGVLSTRIRPGTAWEVPASVQPPNYEAFLHYTRGSESWLEGRYADAAEWYTRAYEADTTFLRALLVAAASMGIAGDPAGSDSLMRAIEPRREELAPYDRYRLDYGMAGQRGEIAAQLRAARAGTELVPSGTLRLALIVSLMEANRPGEALESFEGVWDDMVGVSPGWYPLWARRTEILHMMEEHERELETAREGKELIDSPLQSLVLEARALAALGEVDQIQRVLAEIVSALPPPGTNAEAVLAELAEELLAHEHPVEAAEVVEAALSRLEAASAETFSSPESLELRGRFFYLSNRWTEAGGVFADLAKTGPPSSTILGFRGVIAARMGDSLTARDFSRQLEDLEEPYQNGRKTLWQARIEAVLGNPAEATSLLRRAHGEGFGFGIWLHRDMDLAALHGYSPFEEFIRPKG